ncbi:PAS domain-containing protein [Natrinema zhouii]|uniref:histidine kinase n=1 Tax=Natrinema zhouii TaxID=1710539 RepID=A0A7D6CP98_9EURY|nr:PAS domain-containing protein [Natrinema zhouii]QLK24811.1 PAS domain-containing protein [Natrinema zhouii]
MGASSPTDADLHARLRRQEIITELSQQALAGTDIKRLYRDATAAVAETLDTEYCVVLERLPDGTEGVCRAGVGCTAGAVGNATVVLGRDSRPAESSPAEEPVVVDDLRADERTNDSASITDLNIVSGISVPISTVDGPWGVLETYATERRAFTESDADFVGRVADVLASAVENERAHAEREELFDRISDAFFALDEEWRFTYLNERAHELINPDGRELVGTEVWAEFPEASERAFKSKYERAMSEQETVSFEEYYPEPLDAWFEVRAYPSATGLSVYFRDVTERRVRERELEESERRYRTLVEHFPNGAVALVDEDLCYQTVGGTPLEAADATVAELEGEPLEAVLPPALATELVPRYEAALEGEASAFELSSSGRIYDMQTIPVRDDDGAVFGAIGMSQDITERREYERQLEESERRYRALAQHFPNGAVGVYDRDLTYTLTEGAMVGETLPPADQVEGNRMPDVFPDETVADLEPLFRAAVEDGETGSIETEFGGRNWRVWATPLRDGDGDIFAGLSFAQDVTEQVERENDLERYETIVEVVNDGVYVVDEDRRFTMVNETYAEMLGYAPDELVGTDASAVVDDVVAGQVAELEAATAASDVEWPSIEAELRTADGETLPVEGTFAMLPEDDSRWHRVGIVRDISERKARERRLEESERRYRTLVENFPEGAVGLFDEELAYTAVGGQLLDEVGIAREDRVGSSIDELHPDHLADEIEPYFHAALDGEANSFEVERYDRHLYAHTLPVRNGDDEIFAGMVVVQDVTERREYQRKLEESNERLEQFAYAASHDLQEPLRMVTSYLTLLENRYGDAFDEDGEEFLAYAVDGAERMREMIDGLLEYSRVETQGAPLEPTDLNAVFENVREDLQIQIEENDAEITVDDLPRVEGDASQLRQVLQNLLSNAITYSGDEPARVHVGADRRDDEWVISVRDEGIGIDPADQDRVFTIFDRLHSREEYEGTGIGLALSERIVERHGGEIWVDSEPGEGATFSLTLPAAQERE